MVTAEEEPMSYSVSEIARMAGVTVRTLHHYDRIRRLEALVAAIDRSLEANRMGYQLSAQEKLEIFGAWEPPSTYWSDLAQLRAKPDAFGSTKSWPTPQTKADWQAIEEHRRVIAERIAAAIEAGIAPDTTEAMDLAEDERGAKSHLQQVLIADWYAEK